MNYMPYCSEVEMPLKSISQLRKETEERTGKPVEFYSAFPIIGRGFVRRDTISHADVESLYERAERGRVGYFFHKLFRRKKHNK